MPERDLGLAELPTEAHDLALHLPGEVEQAETHVLQLCAGLLDLLHDGVEVLDQRARHRPLAQQLLGADVVWRDRARRRE